MTLDDILTTALYNYLAPMCLGAGLTDVIFDYSNGVELAGGYAAVDIKRITEDAPAEVVYHLKQGVVNDEIVNYRGTLLFALDIYSDTQAVFIASQIKASMRRESSREEAQRQNLGLVRYGDTLNLSAPQDGKYRHRAQFDVEVNFTIVFKQEDNTIGVVRIHGVIDEKYVIEENITE